MDGRTAFNYSTRKCGKTTSKVLFCPLNDDSVRGEWRAALVFWLMAQQQAESARVALGLMNLCNVIN